jgi:addiction module RelE/StbE family toxin
MKIFYYSKFKHQYKKLPANIRLLAVEREKLFRKDPFDIKLKTHKLHGDLSEYWAFSINFQYRIIFDFVDDNVVRFYNIGKHDIY